jgi:hypothetical protein
MVEVYRACSFRELKTLLLTGTVKGFHDHSGIISLTLDNSFARNLVFNAYVYADAFSDIKNIQQMIVTFDFDKLNNPTIVEYNEKWLDNHFEIKEHIFGTDFEFIDLEQEYKKGSTVQSMINTFQHEKEVIVFDHRMTDGMILKIESQHDELLEDIEKVYKKSGYGGNVEYLDLYE